MNSITNKLEKVKKPKLQYWYHTDVDVCVLCGKETKNRERVFEKNKAGTDYHENACYNHF